MNEHMDLDDIFDEKPHDKCGIFGAYDLDGDNVAQTIYYGLFSLQHRGQESSGISVTDTNGPSGVITCNKGKGLVNEVFDQEKLDKMRGNLGVGHVRYSEAGKSGIEFAEPLVVNYYKGTLALTHNGNIVNANELKEKLSYDGAIFQSGSDSEIVGYLLARERVKTKSVEEALLNSCKQLRGAYSLVITSPRKLIGVRDPFGFRPLCIGKRDNTYFITSETCALDTVDAEFVRDVEPGEIVIIDSEGNITSNKELAAPTPARCIFENIYFSRPDSVFDGVGVNASRIQAGKILARKFPVEADVVFGVPESGNPAGLGYAMESGIPYINGFIKNSYVGRTFIKPRQSQRETAVKIKLNPIKEAIEGKRVVIVDDSIVRGTTSLRIVNMLRAAGANEVHVRISSPLFIHPCFFGTDIPSEEHLIATGRNVEQICEYINADSLGFLDLEDLGDVVFGHKGYCDACFSGNYPVEPPKEYLEKKNKK